MSGTDGVSLSVCTECGRSYFPHRLICAACGAHSWTAVYVSEGTVEEVTTVHRAIDSNRDPVVLATVRLRTGQRVIASLKEVAPRHTPVTLTQRGGVIRGLLQRS